MNELKQQIVEFVKKNGPTIPVKVAKALNSNLMFTSAILGELVSNKVLKISHGKIGNSPVYYTSGQEPKLSMLKNYLSGRLKEAFSILQESKVLRDSSCEPWLRVALRELKDFAHPVTVQIKGNNEIFWKWHLSSNEDAKKMITEIVIGSVQKGAEGKDSHDMQGEENRQKKSIGPGEEREKKEDTQNSSVKSEKQYSQESNANIDAEQSVKAGIEESVLLADKTSRKSQATCDFYVKVLDFLKKNNIKIIDSKIVRKNRELNFIVKMPSPVGPLTFFIKAKNKNKINDADLSLAYSEGQQNKLPVIVLSKGALTKKAGSFISDNIRGLVFKKLD